MIRRSLLTLIDIIDRLRRRDPGLCFDVIDGRLNSERVVLRKKPKAFTAHFDFGPNTSNQHEESIPPNTMRLLNRKTQNFCCGVSGPYFSYFRFD
jgi:hypothetical protein